MTSKRVPTLEEYSQFKRDIEKFANHVPFKREVTRTSYRIELSLEDFNLLVKTDWEAESLSEYLSNILDKHTYALDVDYNGHFGCYIYYMLDKEDDTEEEHEKIADIVHEFLLAAKEKENIDKDE